MSDYTISKRQGSISEYLDTLTRFAYQRFTKMRGNLLSIHFSEIDFENDGRILSLYALYISQFFNHCKLKNEYKICFNMETILYQFEVNTMKSKFGIEIPYQNYSLYQDFVCEVNRLVDKDGCVSIYTNNDPYELEAILLIETNANAEKIKELALKNKLKIINSIEIYECLQNLCIVSKNIVVLSSNRIIF